MATVTVVAVPLGRLSSRPDSWRRTSWATGVFETAHRPHTPHVAGEIVSGRHLIMATLQGGARRHVFTTADGFRHEGPDLTGSVSFLPAGCARRLELHDVKWRWAAIALDASSEDVGASLARVPSMSLKQEPFVFGLLREMERLDALAGGIEPIYAETMAAALTRYLVNRFDARRTVDEGGALPPFKLRRVKDFVASHLDQRLSLAELAALCGLSERHFHRSFKATTGETPLRYVVRQRIERAMLLLAGSEASIAAVAFAVGFANPTHFARAFKDATGMTPSAYRNGAAVVVDQPIDG